MQLVGKLGETKSGFIKSFIQINNASLATGDHSFVWGLFQQFTQKMSTLYLFLFIQTNCSKFIVKN